MSRYLRLHREPVEKVFIEGRGQVFKLAVSVASAALMPTHVFLLQRTLINPYTQTFTPELVGVADPYDVTCYPAEAPETDVFPAYYRGDAVTLYFATLAEVAAAWQDLRTAVAELVRAYDRLDRLTISLEVTLGA